MLGWLRGYVMVRMKRTQSNCSFGISLFILAINSKCILLIVLGNYENAEEAIGH